MLKVKLFGEQADMAKKKPKWDEGLFDDDSNDEVSTSKSKPKKKESLSINVKDKLTNEVLKQLGTPRNLVKVEAYQYNWGETSNRWRVNIVTEEEIHTELGTYIPAWRRHDSFFLHFDESSEQITYCNPPIIRKYP